MQNIVTPYLAADAEYLYPRYEADLLADITRIRFDAAAVGAFGGSRMYLNIGEQILAYESDFFETLNNQLSVVYQPVADFNLVEVFGIYSTYALKFRALTSQAGTFASSFATQVDGIRDDQLAFLNYYTTPWNISLSPADGAQGVAVVSNIALAFSEAIQRGTGEITIRQGSATGAVVETFDAATSNRLAISGSTLTIDPTSDLAGGTQHFVVLPSGAVKDLAGNNYSGTTSYNFTTSPAQISIVSVSVSPVYVSESDGTNLTYTFTRSGDISSALTINVGLAGTAGSADYTVSPVVWTELLGTSGNDTAWALATGLDGSIYVSGHTTGVLDGQTNSGNYDAFLTKYSADGTKAWTRLLGTSSDDVAFTLTTGIDGAIYVGGYTKGAFDGQINSGGNDAFLTKYSPDGTKAWTKLLGTSSEDHAYALATGLDGSIYVSGYTSGALDGQAKLDGQVSSTNVDGFLTKYSADGTKAWTRLLGTSSDDVAFTLTTGIDGAIYVGGYTKGAFDGQINSGGNDAFLTKYSPDGTKAWTRLLGTSSDDVAYASTTGLDGSIYVGGRTSGSLDGQNNSGRYDAFLTKYSPDGTKDWTRLLGTSSDDVANALTIGLDGSIYVSGYTNGALDGQANRGGGDAFLTKYSPDGTKAWTKLLGTSGNEGANTLATGLDGSIYISGRTDGTLNGQTNSGNYDAFLSKFYVSPPITFAAGSSTAALVLAPTSDSVLEGNETVVVTVLAGAGYALGPTLLATGIIDDTPPEASIFSPADAATGVAVGSNIVLTFSEAIQKGTGSIEIRAGSATGTVVESFNAASSDRLTISGSMLTIDPTSNLANSTQYFVTFASGSIRDLAGNNYAGTTTYDFTTAAPADTTAPTVTTFSPLDAATGVAVGSNITLTFSEAIQRGTGEITIRQGSATGAVVETFDAATSNRLAISGSTLTIDPTSDLAGGTQHFVVLPSGAVKDLAGNNYEGTSVYDFNTESAVTSSNLRAGYIWAAPDPNGDTVYGSTPPVRFSYVFKDGLANLAEGAAITIRVDTTGYVLGDILSVQVDEVVRSRVTTPSSVTINSEDIDRGFAWFRLHAAADFTTNGDREFNLSVGSESIRVNLLDTSKANSPSVILIPHAIEGLSDKDANQYTREFLVEGEILTGIFYAPGSGDGFIRLAGIDSSDFSWRSGWKTGDNSAYLASNVSTTFGTLLNDNGQEQETFQIFVTSGRYDTTLKRIVQSSKWSGSATEISLLDSYPPERDLKGPSAHSFSPLDAATGVAVGSNIVLTFDEEVQVGTGSITIRRGSATGTVVETFDVESSNRLTISGSTLTIDPTSNLSHNTQYFVVLPSGAVKDLANNSFVGTNTYDFTTVAAPPTETTRLIGEVYHWKTRALLSGVEIEAVPVAGTGSGSAAKLFELRNVDVTGSTLKAELWVNSGGSSFENLDLSLGFSSALSATFQSNSALGGWSLVDNSTLVNGVRMLSLGGFAGQPSAALSGSVKLGEITVTSPTGTSGMEVGFLFGEVGNSSLIPYAVNYGAYKDTTGVDGVYELAGLPSGSFMIDALKALGSAETGSVISSADALAALKIAVGRSPNSDNSQATPYQFISADVNGSGSVTSADALAILKMAVKRSDAPAREWIFVDEKHDFWNEATSAFTTTRTSVPKPSDLAITVDPAIRGEVNLVGMLKGDVNGSWTPPAASSLLPESYFTNLAVTNPNTINITQFG